VCKNTPFERTVVKLPGSHFFAGSVLQDQSDQEIISVRVGDRPIFRNVANRPPGRNDSIFGIVVDGIQFNHLFLDPGVRSYGVVPPVGLPLGEPG